MSSKNKSVPSAGEKQFYVQSVAPEELSDYMFVLSMILGAAAMFVKYRLLAWGCFVSCVIGWVNMKQGEPVMKQLFSSFSLALVGLVLAYIGPTAHQFR
jgi:uncharacterized membrane protein YeaQ/YmgE (transglycosylase-associated protein family)